MLRYTQRMANVDVTIIGAVFGGRLIAAGRFEASVDDEDFVCDPHYHISN